MSGVYGFQNLSSRELDAFSTSEVDRGRGVEPDARMAMVAVIPAEEASAERAAIFNPAKTLREPWPVFERLKLGFGIRIIVGAMRTRVAPGDAQIGHEQRHGLGGHGRAAIGMDGQLVGEDVVLTDGLGDELLSQLGRLTLGQQPARNVAAVDVDDDVEVEIGPFLRTQ